MAKIFGGSVEQLGNVVLSDVSCFVMAWVRLLFYVFYSLFAKDKLITVNNLLSNLSIFQMATTVYETDNRISAICRLDNGNLYLQQNLVHQTSWWGITVPPSHDYKSSVSRIRGMEGLWIVSSLETAPIEMAKIVLFYDGCLHKNYLI